LLSVVQVNLCIIAVQLVLVPDTCEAQSMLRATSSASVQNAKGRRQFPTASLKTMLVREDGPC
jgi:hypothetical protein